MSLEFYPQELKSIGIKGPGKIEVIIIRFLVLSGFWIMIVFLSWFLDRAHIGHPLIYWLLLVALMFKMVKMLHEWYHYWDIRIKPAPGSHKDWTVDIMTTSCRGEPREMILKTLNAMINVRYPHKNYLCDEGSDEWLKEECKRLGVIHVTRTEKTNAKAGNINNALRQAKGEIVVVLDPDHEPFPDFLDHVLSYFEDDKVGYVQVVQAYCNQGESFISRGAAEQTYHFYGPMMICMSNYGTTQAIGANCTFRRKALDSIGGHAPGLAEDMHTAMQIHAKGWKSVYVPRILSRGLVPATLPAYYSQQLKWSRGTFDLLFNSYPKLFRKFTFRQKLHYLSVPVYFLFGLINLFDFLVPLLALLLSDTPWNLDLYEFAYRYLPLCGISILIRIYIQQWLFEPSERGLHLNGGILRTGTWWVFLLGFFYTIFNIKVPYIPTPKEDNPRNNWLLSIPNIMVCLISIAVVIYGLNQDYNPFSLLMAGFALLNVIILSIVIFAGQQKIINKIAIAIKDTFIYNFLFHPISQLTRIIKGSFYSFIRMGAASFALGLGFIFLSYSTTEETLERYNEVEGKKSTGGFFCGLFSPGSSHTNVYEYYTAALNKPDVISKYIAWGDQSFSEFKNCRFDSVIKFGAIPMITWEPWINTFSEYSGMEEYSNNKKVFKKILEGKFDAYIDSFAILIGNLPGPVFLRFAHEMDNPQYPWSSAGENSSQDFKNGWKYVVERFIMKGTGNVAWVYTPWKPEAITKYYPGEPYVDWISFDLLNYREFSPDKQSYSFEELFLPYYKSYNALKKTSEHPIMIAEFGSLGTVNDRLNWMLDAFSFIEEIEEIQGVVFFDQPHDYNIPPGNEAKIIDWSIPWDKLDFRKTFKQNRFSNLNRGVKTSSDNLKEGSNSNLIMGIDGHFSFLVDKKPFYIKGIAYNPAHDWRDGFLPLTRHQLEKDFGLIAKSGANSIRRYSPGVYDKNILTIANEFNLKVVYGFWFDPEIDYYMDSAKISEYEEQVYSGVMKMKNYNSILAWSLGNETYGLLKHKFTQPYLTFVRKAYVRMIEKLAYEIHALDREHPVFTAMEHSWQLPCEIKTFKRLAPSVDAIGINSYYEMQVSSISGIMKKNDPGRPYIISEFGPKGYWNPELSDLIDDSLIIESSDEEKSKWYFKQWNKYILPEKGSNLGGFAYCWRDRMEGSYTWYGLMDSYGFLKPSYNGIASAYLNKERMIFPEIEISGDGFYFPVSTKTTFKINGVSKLNDPYWMIFSKDFKDKYDNLDPGSEPGSCEVTMPSSPGNYRIYYFGLLENGYRVTASRPFVAY